MFSSSVIAVVLFVLFTSGASVKIQGRLGNNTRDPYIFKDYFLYNRMQQCAERSTQPRLPLSYAPPVGYFDSVPPADRVPPGDNTQPAVIPACNNRLVEPKDLLAYDYDSERFLATLGLNIYDGSVWSLALAALGEIDEVYNYMKVIIHGGETCQFADIRGDAPCRGDIITGQCADPSQSGGCGFCYGDGSDRTAPRANAFTFRMISDYWALLGTVDARCPDLQHLWTWNDYRPVLGENAWANLLAPLQVAFMKYKSVAAIPSTDLSVIMAIDILPTLQKLMTPVGAVYYAPHNTLQSIYYDLGFSVSTENNVSLLSGLKALRYYLMVNQVYLDKLPMINALIEAVTAYLKSAYSPHLGYFVQGGSFDPNTMKFTWATGATMFAVDCQTWLMSNIAPTQIDEWFGAGTAEQIWENTKQLGGFNYNSETGWVDGLGFTSGDNSVFSGEWTMGAVNMLKIFAEEYPEKREEYLAEAEHMRNAVQSQLLVEQTIEGHTVTGIAYSNKRYFIPFGWWANPILSTASTGWAVLYDLNYNPFHLGGEFVTNYPL